MDGRFKRSKTLLAQLDQDDSFVDERFENSRVVDDPAGLPGIGIALRAAPGAFSADRNPKVALSPPFHHNLQAPQWAQAQKWMDAALALQPHQRQDFLDQECVDQTMRQEVLSLLAYAGSTTTFVDQPAVQPPSVVDEEVSFPEQVGSYRLLRPLGHGGMGSVYLAVRSDGVYQKPIALKLLQAGIG